MIRVFVETPRGRDSAGFTVPESAAEFWPTPNLKGTNI